MDNIVTHIIHWINSFYPFKYNKRKGIACLFLFNLFLIDLYSTQLAHLSYF